MKLREKYGKTALVAGASQGLGAAFSRYLAREGMDLVLVARRPDPLKELAEELIQDFGVQVQWISCDLATHEAAAKIQEELQGKEINLLVYNAAISYIGHFIEQGAEKTTQLALANMITPMNMIHTFGPEMLAKRQGAIVLMGSLAGFQGSGYLSAYAASKAFNRILGESLWYEWKNKGVDVMTCCAGATSTPNYIDTKPEKTSIFAPKVQTPEAVVEECFKKLGKKPSIITGSGNKFASFIMQKLMPRKTAINTMGDNTRKMYRIEE